jgi:ABC-type phosphate transport system substrate-binding protein
MRNILLCLILLALFSTSVQAEIQIIVNKSVPVSNLSDQEIKNIFLAKVKKWDNGKKIIIMTLKSSSVHDQFTREFTNKNSSQFKRYWRKLGFTGKAIPPRSYSSEESLIKALCKTDYSIGYISTGPEATGKECIKIIRK